MTFCMALPENWEQFLQDYEFKDSKEVYTNGSRLIASFRVEQMVEHYFPVEALPVWIPVQDKLPAPGEIVLVRQLYSWENYEEGAEITIGRLRPVPPDETPYWEFQHYRPDFRNATCIDNDIICPGNEYVTHWMPLPEATGRSERKEKCE